MQAPTFPSSWKQLQVNTAFGKLMEGFFCSLPEDYLFYLYHLYYWSGCTMFFLSLPLAYPQVLIPKVASLSIIKNQLSLLSSKGYNPVN